MKVQKVEGMRLLPRDSVPFLRENQKLWEDLRAGKVIDIPDDVFVQLVGVKEVSGKKQGPHDRILEVEPVVNDIEEVKENG